jgi:hypothetical protein
VEKKIQALPVWLTTGNQLDAVQPAQIVEAPRATWSILAGSYFLKVGATDDLSPALTKIDTDMKAAVIARIDEFNTVVTVYRTAHPTAVPAIDQNVAPLLKRAKDNAQAANWAGMTSAFRQGRLAYAKVLASGFDAIFTAPEPLGFAAPDWQAVRARIATMMRQIQQESDPDQAVERYREANETYLDEVIGKLDIYADGLAAANDPVEAQNLKDAKTSLSAAMLARQKGDWETTRTAYTKAAAAVKSAGRTSHFVTIRSSTRRPHSSIPSSRTRRAAR